jgi:hypothetical protein
MSTDKIIYSSIFISILGFVAQYLGWIGIPDIGSRYYGLFLSPQSAALIDFFTLAYLIKLRFTSRLYISLSFIMFFLILKTECVPVIVIATIYIIYNIYKFKITFYQYLIAIVIESKNIFGRIVNGLMTSKCMDPIIYFDELDKISQTPKGEEITNILVHLTDPVQNGHFRDKYFHCIDIDLSKVTFIFSFNDPRNVNPILLDRVTCIETKYLLFWVRWDK